MGGVYSVKLFRNEGEAEVEVYGQKYRITVADLEASGISDGDEADGERNELLEQACEKLACIKKAQVYLSYRALPKRKLWEKLKRAGFGEDAVENTVELLERKGYINDGELCAEYAEALQRSKGYGGARLRKELYAKGFERDLVEEAVEAVSAENDAELVITELLCKKFPSLQPEDRQARSKAAAYLYRMGYTYDEINNAIEAFGRE